MIVLVHHLYCWFSSG